MPVFVKIFVLLLLKQGLSVVDKSVANDLNLVRFPSPMTNLLKIEGEPALLEQAITFCLPENPSIKYDRETEPATVILLFTNLTPDKKQSLMNQLQRQAISHCKMEWLSTE